MARAYLNPCDAAAAVLIVATAFVRVWLIALGLPRFDSDEGTMGLMALHIGYHGEHPIFFYGQAYMGALQAYLAGVAFHVLGVSDLTLRLGLVLLTVLFLTAMYLLIRLLYSGPFALLSLALLCLGSSELLNRELKAVGGCPEMLVFGAAALLLAADLGMSEGSARSRRRLLLYAVCGLMVGLGLWSDPLILPFVAAAALLLILTCRRELRGPAGLALLGGIVLGVLPVVLYNLTTPAGGGTLSAILRIVQAGGTGHTSAAPASLPERLAGTLAVSIPVMTGGAALCSIPPQDAWPLTSHSGAHTIGCTVAHGIWGGAFVALWITACVLSVASLARLQRSSDHPSAESRRHRTRELARLATLGAAGLTVGLFVASPTAAHAPWYNVRYLVGLWIAVPAIVAPLARPWRVPGRAPVGIVQMAGLGGLLLLALAGMLGTVSVFDNASYVAWLYGQRRALAAALIARGDTRMYTDYWTCDWLAFETREQLWCAVLDNRLHPSSDRYRPYRTAVRRVRLAPYVFPADSPQVAALARIVRRHPGSWRRWDMAGYIVYQRHPTEERNG